MSNTLLAQQTTVTATGEILVRGFRSGGNNPNLVTIIADADILIGGDEANATYPVAAGVHFPLTVRAGIDYHVKAATGTATVNVLNSVGYRPEDIA